MGTTKPQFRSIVIFGGAGFIGSNWTERLLKTTEAKVHVFDNLSRHGARHNLEYLQKLAGRTGRLQITVGDVRDAAMVSRVVRYATEIYNFAAQVAVTTSLADPRLDFEVNLGGTFNILEAARGREPSPYLLFTSTNKVYGNSSDDEVRVEGKRYVKTRGCGTDESHALDFHSPYGCSKGAADQYVRDYARIYGLQSAVFRMSCIAGPRQFGSEDQGWVAHFLYSALEGKPLRIYGDGRQVRDILYVEDLLCAFEAAYVNREHTAGQIYNIGGGEENSISLLELMDRVEALTGARTGYNFGEQRVGDQLVYITNHGKFSRHTGWQPKVNLDGIRERHLQVVSRQSRAVCALARRAPGGRITGSGAEDGVVARYALVNPNWDFAGSTYFGCRDPHTPLELLFAAQKIQAKGNQALVVDAQTDDLTLDATREQVAAFDPDFLVIPSAPSYLFWRCPPPELRIPREWFAGIGGRAAKVLIGPHGSATPRAAMHKTGARRGHPRRERRRARRTRLRALGADRRRVLPRLATGESTTAPASAWWI